jgi:hypothetical protein
MKAKKPTAQDYVEAKLEKNKAFAAALREKCLIRSAVEKQAKIQGVWDDDMKKELEEVRSKLAKGEAQLGRGGKTPEGNPFTKQDARTLAIDMMEWRGEFLTLNSVLSGLDQYTCEAKAEDAEFDVLCSRCIVTDTGIRVFDSVEDYRKRANEEEVEKAAGELAQLTSGYDPDWYKKLPEVAFLIKYGFMNDDLQLTDGDKLVDKEGNFINGKGQRVNDAGELINEFGDVIDEEGKVKDFVEFA